MRGKDDDEILRRALEMLLDRVAPERRHRRRLARGAVAKGQKKGEVESRRGRLKDRDQALVEGGCQCAYVAVSGRRCEERAFLVIDQARPWALGGSSERQNLRPMCWAHNAMLGEKAFPGKYRRV